MDANTNEESQITNSTQVAAMWEKIDQLRREAATGKSAAQSGRPEAAAQADDMVDELMKAGECHCTTHPQSSREEEENGPRIVSYSGGFDWFEWTMWVNWPESQFATVMHLFKAKKQECQDRRANDLWIEITGIGPMRIFRQGLNRGGARGQHFEFELSVDGITLGVAKRAATENMPNAFAQIRGRECLLLGAEQGLARIREVIDGLGGEIAYEKIGRADFCLDAAELPIDALQVAVELGSVITRAKGVFPNRDALDGIGTGFHAGKNPLRLNVYDKLAELLPKHDDLYLQAMKDRRWFGKLPKAATRIEFQVSRQWLLNHGVSSVRNLLEKQAAIIAYLVEEWFRITSEPVDRANQNHSRAETSPLWSSISEGFAWVFGRGQADLQPILRDKVAPLRCAKQARGCLRSYLLQCGIDIQSIRDFAVEGMRAILATFQTELEKQEFLANYQRMKTEFGQ